MIIDTHCHLYLSEFSDDRLEVVERAKQEGVVKILLPNIDADSVESLTSLFMSDPDFFVNALGLHPTSVKKDYKPIIESMLNSDLNIVAIGEIGIDLYWDQAFIEEQKDAFAMQLSIAKEKDLPIIIHSRNSFDEVMDVLTPFAKQGVRGVFHCFPGDLSQAKKVIDLGFCIGIGGVLTYKKSQLPEVVAKIPLESILLETDAPYLSPVPKRGKRNEPSYLKHIVQKISLLKNMEYEKVCHQTTANAVGLFKF